MSVQLSRVYKTKTFLQPLPEAPVAPSRVSTAYRAAAKGWSYSGTSLKVTRHFLNAGLRARLLTKKESVGRAQNFISRSKIFSALSVGFNLANFSTHVAKIGKNLERGDVEGVSLALLTFAILIADTLDSLLTSVSGAFETLALKPSPWIGSLGLPLGFAIVSLGSLSRTIRLYHLHQFSKSLSLVETSCMTPHRFLKDFPLDDPQKMAALERHTSEGTTNLLKNLSVSLETIDPSDEKNMGKAVETLHRLQRHVLEEMAIQIAYFATNLLIFTALCLMAASFTTPLPYILLGTAWTARMGIQAYQDLGQELPTQKN
jgi:hypothetical protein